MAAQDAPGCSRRGPRPGAPARARALLPLALVALVAACTPTPDDAAPEPAEEALVSTMQWDAPPPMTIDPSGSYQAVIRTSAGDITVRLLAAESPATVNNFVFLAREGFYDGVIFHRVIAGFMIQGGDPTGTGSGGPGYRFADELEAARSLGYRMGTVAMANAGANTNGSQFFIMHQDYGLPPNYSVFGRTIDGLDVVDAIASAPTGAQDRPVEPVVIEGIDIVEG